MYISQNLRFLRKAAGLSQAALAERIGLNRGNIASYEKGAAEPSINNLLRISRFFNVDLVDMLDRDLSESDMADRMQVVSEEGEVITARIPRKPLSQLMNQYPDNNDGGNQSIQLLGEQTIALSKVVEGLKTYHNMRMQRLNQFDRDHQITLVDYDRLIQVAEEILEINRQLIKLDMGGKK
ncbi:MAG: helix-turn-helix domain-containing protein [Bacteroidota bacterium]